MTKNVMRTTEEPSYNIKIARPIIARAVRVHVERKKRNTIKRKYIHNFTTIFCEPGEDYVR